MHTSNLEDPIIPLHMYAYDNRCQSRLHLKEAVTQNKQKLRLKF